MALSYELFFTYIKEQWNPEQVETELSIRDASELQRSLHALPFKGLERLVGKGLLVGFPSSNACFSGAGIQTVKELLSEDPYMSKVRIFEPPEGNVEDDMRLPCVGRVTYALMAGFAMQLEESALPYLQE